MAIGLRSMIRAAFRVPVFHSSGAAMLARSRETGMECFRPVVLDAAAFKNLTTTDEGKACFLVGRRSADEVESRPSARPSAA